MTRFSLCLVLVTALSLSLGAQTPDLPTFAEPALVTTVGGADGSVVRVMLRQAGVEAELVNAPTAEDLEGVATLVVAMGTSELYLHTANTTPEAEAARGAQLLDQVRAQGIAVLGVHVGGSPRRGAIHDPPCRAVAERSDALVVTAGGNGDGFFTVIATERNIPLIEPADTDAMVQTLAGMFD